MGRFDDKFKRVSPLENHEGPIDYKDLNLLKRFLSERGKIIPRRSSGVSAQQQRAVALAIKHARFLGLLPYTKD